MTMKIENPQFEASYRDMKSEGVKK